MRRIVTTDVGGTNARFAIAVIDNGRVVSLDEPVTLKTADYASFETAWEEFDRRFDPEIPRELSIAFAGPVEDDVLKLTNSPWVMRPAAIRQRLNLERLTVVNDFGAVAHAVARLEEEHFTHLCGPQVPLPQEGMISIVGPGTGLGVAGLMRRGDAGYDVVETEGGHVDFAPLDAVEDRILRELRQSFRRVSVERIASGRGLWNIYEALAKIENRPTAIHDEKQLWMAALEGRDSLAAAALDRLCLTLGATTGDMALAHGAVGVVIGGGVGLRLAEHLPRSGFRERFTAKGRFERRMDAIPVKLITHPQPGLFGAAAAFAREHG